MGTASGAHPTGLAIILESIQDRGAILFAEVLEVQPTQAAALHDLAEVTQFDAAMSEDNRRVLIQRLLWRFQKEVDLGPLTRTQVGQLVERWLAERLTEFDGPRVCEGSIRAVQLDSADIPAAVEGMLVAAHNDGEVTRSRLREYRHEAAASYWSLTPEMLDKA